MTIFEGVLKVRLINSSCDASSCGFSWIWPKYFIDNFYKNHHLEVSYGKTLIPAIECTNSKMNKNICSNNCFYEIYNGDYLFNLHICNLEPATKYKFDIVNVNNKNNLRSEPFSKEINTGILILFN